MVTHQRMSPFTALFMGISSVIAVGIVSGATVTLYALNVIDTKAATLLDFTGSTVQNLPEIIESLPAVFSDIVHDRRSPEYASNIDVDVSFILDEKRGTLRPALNITNNGEEVVSVLAIRVAALNESQVPLREWTEVVATPIAIDRDWRGPLMPGATRHVLLHAGWRGVSLENAEKISGAIEISEIRVWEPQARSVTTLTSRD